VVSFTSLPPLPLGRGPHYSFDRWVTEPVFCTFAVEKNLLLQLGTGSRPSYQIAHRCTARTVIFNLAHLNLLASSFDVGKKYLIIYADPQLNINISFIIFTKNPPKSVALSPQANCTD
jgi:hypothetical protein